MAGLNFLIERNVLNALEDAEMLANVENGLYQAFLNPLEALSDKQFVKLYRLTKSLTEELIELLEPHLVPPSRASALSIPRKDTTLDRSIVKFGKSLIDGSSSNIMENRRKMVPYRDLNKRDRKKPLTQEELLSLLDESDIDEFDDSIANENYTPDLSDLSDLESDRTMSSASQRSRLLLDLAVGRRSIDSNIPSTSKISILSDASISDVSISKSYDATSKKHTFYGTENCQSGELDLTPIKPSPSKYTSFGETTNEVHYGDQIDVPTCEESEVLEFTSKPSQSTCCNSNHILETGCNSHVLPQIPTGEFILDAETGIRNFVDVREIVDSNNCYLDEVSGLFLPNEPSEVPENFDIDDSSGSETFDTENVSKTRNKNKIQQVLGQKYNSRTRKCIADDNSKSKFYYDLHTGRSIKNKQCLHSATA
ncbi:unnamed protein product [Diabrotica balteata]|uniref:Uncharacterized protein n=1 Tax=Diabrotica balteata TaxID=107213 RepID=A0A9N9T3Q6_DIABA|nr:unnamed protein product [Diabrotica balteata]